MGSASLHGRTGMTAFRGIIFPCSQPRKRARVEDEKPQILSDVTAQWIASNKQKWTPETLDRYAGIVNGFVEPKLGLMPLSATCWSFAAAWCSILSGPAFWKVLTSILGAATETLPAWRGGPRFSPRDWILSQFAKDRSNAQFQYKRFVMAGIGQLAVWDELKSQCILGSDKFIAWLRPALQDKAELKEIPRLQRFASRPPLDNLFPKHCSLGKLKRDELMKKAHLEFGYSFSEIGRHVGLHYSTVSRVAREQQSWRHSKT